MDEPVRSTPLDRCGYKNTCCKCIPLKIAATLICFVSFFWSAAELIAADKYIARVFPDRGDDFYYVKWCYIVVNIGFAIANGILMIGIFTMRYFTVTIYVWMAIVYTIIYMCMYGVVLGLSIANGTMKRKYYIRTFFGCIWILVYWYFLKVVNSFRISLWWEF